MDIDFDKKVIQGYVSLGALIEKEGADTLILDTRSITIHSVVLEEGEGTKPLTWAFGEAHAVSK